MRGLRVVSQIADHRDPMAPANRPRRDVNNRPHRLVGSSRWPTGSRIVRPQRLASGLTGNTGTGQRLVRGDRPSVGGVDAKEADVGVVGTTSRKTNPARSPTPNICTRPVPRTLRFRPRVKAPFARRSGAVDGPATGENPRVCVLAAVSVDAGRRQRDQPAVLRPGLDVAEPVRQPQSALGGSCRVGVVHRVPAVVDHPSRGVVPHGDGRRGDVEGVRRDRDRGDSHRPGEAGGRDLRMAVHPERGRPLRPDQYPDRPGVRHRRGIPEDVRDRQLVRRHDHRRRRARSHRQGRRFPARGDEIRRLPGHLPHGRNRPPGLGRAPRRPRRVRTRSTSTWPPRNGWTRPVTSSGACSG